MKSRHVGQLVITTSVCAMALTAGMVDLMVSSASNDAAQSQAASDYNNVAPLPSFTPDYPLTQIPTADSTECLPAASGYNEVLQNPAGKTVRVIHTFSVAQDCVTQSLADQTGSNQ
jgi:hypothetical protein